MKVRRSVAAAAVVLGVACAGLFFAQASPPAKMTHEFQQKWEAAEVTPFQGTVLGHATCCRCIYIEETKGVLALRDDYAKFDQNYDTKKGLRVGKSSSGFYKTIDKVDYAAEVHQK